jgi:GNAT superfamily N-acetyltransferase
MEWMRDGFVVSCDPRKLDRALVAGFLHDAYWSRGIPPATVDRSIEGSLCFSLWSPASQVGFARVVSDRATFAYLGDVFVVPEYRGRGLGKWLVQCVLSHPDLQGLRRWVLVTRDAHELYRSLGFCELARPEGYMERHDPEVYRRS